MKKTIQIIKFTVILISATILTQKLIWASSSEDSQKGWCNFILSQKPSLKSHFESVSSRELIQALTCSTRGLPGACGQYTSLAALVGILNAREVTASQQNLATQNISNIKNLVEHIARLTRRMPRLSEDSLGLNTVQFVSLLRHLMREYSLLDLITFDYQVEQEFESSIVGEEIYSLGGVVQHQNRSSLHQMLVYHTEGEKIYTVEPNSGRHVVFRLKSLSSSGGTQQVLIPEEDIGFDSFQPILAIRMRFRDPNKKDINKINLTDSESLRYLEHWESQIVEYKRLQDHFLQSDEHLTRFLDQMSHEERIMWVMQLTTIVEVANSYKVEMNRIFNEDSSQSEITERDIKFAELRWRIESFLVMYEQRVPLLKRARIIGSSE